MPSLAGFLKPIPTLSVGLLVPVYNRDDGRAIQEFDRNTFIVRRFVNYSDEERFYSVADAQHEFGFTIAMIESIDTRYVGQLASFAFHAGRDGMCGSSIELIRLLEQNTIQTRLSSTETRVVTSFLMFLRSKQTSPQLSSFVARASAPNKAPLFEKPHVITTD